MHFQLLLLAAFAIVCRAAPLPQPRPGDSVPLNSAGTPQAPEHIEPGSGATAEEQALKNYRDLSVKGAEEARVKIRNIEKDIEPQMKELSDIDRKIDELSLRYRAILNEQGNASKNHRSLIIKPPHLD